MKKFLSLVLMLTFLCSLFGGFTALAAEDNLVSGNLLCNGDMELLGTPFGKWHTKADYVSLGFARNGERSMKLKTDGRIILQQDIFGVVPGQKYTFTAYLYVKELLTNAKDVGGCMKIEFHREGETESLTHISGSAVFECFPGEKDKWVKCEISGIAPDEAVKAKLHLRIDCGGEIYWDDATFVGAVSPEDYEVIAAERDLAAATWAHSNELLAEVQAKEARTELAPGAVNCVLNPSFEEVSSTGDYPANWTGFRSEWNKVTFLSDEEAHSGNYSAKIVGTPDTYQPWVMHTMQGNFIADSDYVLSAWVKAKEIEALNGVFMKAECYSSTNATGNTATGSAESSIHKFRDSDWHQIKLVFTMPQNTSVVKIYLRTSTGNAVIHYDDIEFGPAASLTVMEFLPKFTFNYTENENIETTTTINYINNPIEAGSVVEYTVKDGDTVIVQEAVPAAANMTWSFPTMKLAEKEKAYKISAVYKKADGSVIESSEERNIYRYDRPTMIDEQGRFIDETGKPLDIVYLYGAWEKYYADYAAAGITVIRPDDVRFDTIANIPEIRRLMDSAHEHGLKVLYQLYGKVAGHPLQIPTTKRLVTEFKDHPALLGWMMVDEPSYQILPGRQAQSYPEMLEYMEEGYKVIRAIDPHHPIYNLETVGVPNSYELAFQYVDIASVDLYPNDSTETTYTYKGVQRAVNAVHDEKEVWNLGYASDWDANYTPDADGLRMQNYMAIWAGASGFGYYACDEYTPYMLEALKQSNKSGERHQMFDHFVRENSPIFDEYQGADYWQRSWVDDQGKMFLLVKEHKNDGKNTEVNFNLKSTNGLVEVNGYMAKLVNGTTEKTIVSDDSSFKLTLTPTQISLYEIVPNTPVDFSAITQPVYNDLAGFEWAEESITNITKNKIANNKGIGIYAPGENITRGDFAMYLIRALGLTADASDQFSDVDPNAPYAKEIAIGKKLGILKGSGDGTYSPEESISRQDLMVICARGLRLARRIADADYKTAIANFRDKGLIADYAVNDIGAMVSSRIITGNPDLTINPLGNTTRAEAAVIMDRITKQN